MRGPPASKFEQLDLDLMGSAVMMNVHRLIGEVAARNGIQIDPNDPAFVLVTLNRLVLEEAVTQIGERIRSGIAEFADALQKAEARAGKVLAEEVREAAADVREELQRDVETARASVREIVYELHREHTRVASPRWGTGSIMLPIVMFATGLWVGAQFIR